MQWRTCLVALLVAAPAIAQTTASNSLSLQAAMERAFAANPTIAAARLSRAINVAGLAAAGEYLNPDVFVEIEKDTPKQAFGFVMPLELGGKRAKRIAVSEATLRAGDAELSATIAQVRNDVRRAYFDVAVAEERLVILRDLRDLSRRARDSGGGTTVPPPDECRFTGAGPRSLAMYTERRRQRAATARPCSAPRPARRTR